MKFKEFLLEMKPMGKFQPNWLNNDVNGLYTFLHIDNNDDIYVTKNQNFNNSKETFTVLMEEDFTVEHITAYYFKFKDSQGRTTQTSAIGSLAIKVFPTIEKIFETMVNEIPEDSYIGFCAYLTEPKRIRLYDRFIKKIGLQYKTYDNEYIQKIRPDPKYKLYGFYKNIKRKSIPEPEKNISKFNYNKAK